MVARFNDVDGLSAVFREHGDRIAGVIVEPVVGNMGVVAPETGSLPIEAVTRAMKRLKGWVEQRDSVLLSRFGFAEPCGFFKQFQWLNGILVWKSQGDVSGQEKNLWANSQAKRPLLAAVASLLTS